MRGNLDPHLFPSGSLEEGPVVPWQPPKTFEHTTNHSLVSIAKPSPTNPSHQPLERCPSVSRPAT